jgi:hypothetical protein
MKKNRDLGISLSQKILNPKAIKIQGMNWQPN